MVSKTTILLLFLFLSLSANGWADSNWGTLIWGQDHWYSESADTDGDGILDHIEDASCSNSLDADTDDDGIMDGIEDKNLNGVVDAGETDPCNPDSDGDGVQDGTEAGYTSDDIGPDTNTSIFQPDLDPTTTTDPLLGDTDGDGRLDGQEDANHNGRVDPGESDPNVYNVRGMPWIDLLLLTD